jgi:hypothetical protein
MSNGWEKSKNISDRVADRIDRKLTSKTKTKIPTLAEQLAEFERQKTFEERYPHFGVWENSLIKYMERHKYYSGGRENLPLDEINQCQGKTGSAAYLWIKSLYNKEIEPAEAAREITNLIYK